MDDSVEETMKEEVAPRRLAQSSPANPPRPPPEGQVDIPASAMRTTRKKARNKCLMLKLYRIVGMNE